MASIDTPFPPHLLEKVNAILSKDPEAWRFLSAFHEYCHRIDDIIDEKITDAEFILKTFALAASVYSSNFYQRYGNMLYPFVLTMTNAYADSVKWEKSTIEWQRNVADVLRGVGHDLLMLVIGIVGGYDSMRELSLELREHFYNDQHDSKGNPT